MHHQKIQGGRYAEAMERSVIGIRLLRPRGRWKSKPPQSLDSLSRNGVVIEKLEGEMSPKEPYQDKFYEGRRNKRLGPGSHFEFAKQREEGEKFRDD